MPATPELLKAIAVTAKVMGNDLDEASARMFADDLSAYPQSAVIDSLSRCRREVRGRLTIADVVQRLDDGRPGVEEAWAMLPHDESASVVWCQEMATAFGVCLPLLESGDKVGARMAFKESYSAELLKARSNGVPVKFWPSYGTDMAGRVKALMDATERGRIGKQHAANLIEHHQPNDGTRTLEGMQPMAGVLEKLAP